MIARTATGRDRPMDSSRSIHPMLPLETLVEHVPDLTGYQLILVSISGGKDSQAALDVLYRTASAVGVVDRVVVVHADMGRMEWPGVAMLARERAEHYGLPFRPTRRDGPDLLTQIAQQRCSLPVQLDTALRSQGGALFVGY